MADTERTEPATPRRKQEARQRGQVAKSAELNTALILLAAFIILRYLTPFMTQGIQGLMSYSFLNLGAINFTEQNIISYSLRLMVVFGIITMPFILIIAFVAIITNLLQVGFLHSGFVLRPKLSRINPLAGLKRIFSYRGIVELCKSVLKIAIITAVAYFIIRPEIERLMLTIDMAPAQSTSYISALVLRLGIRMGLFFVFFAVADYLYQRWEYEKSLRMTKYEVKEEYIRYEGRPEVRQRIRSIQRQLAMRRMMQEVPKADVVITNPAHLAIALKYDPQEMVAPKVLAKGARLVAQKIVEIAKEHNIPLVENKPLARLLFKLVEIGQFIPLQLYQAVADVLAFVWRTGKLKKKFF